MDIAGVRAALNTNVVGREILAYDSVPTTMSIASELAAGGTAEGLVIVADEQTAGRGRFERRWEAPKGSSVMLSVLLRPESSILADLPLIGALAAAEAVESLCSLVVGIKWPNDLLVDGRKFGGILTESRGSADATAAIIGIGLNVNFDPAGVPGIPESATSLSNALGEPIDREKLLAALLNRLDVWLGRLREGSRPLDAWSRRLETIGKTVEVTIGNRRIRGVAEGVDDQGRLLLRQESGPVQALAAGEVTLQQ